MENMNANHYYGFLVLAGGLYAYYKSKSAISAVASTAFFAAYFYCGQLENTLMDHDFGVRCSLATSVLLALAMGKRYLRTKKVMPAGLITGLFLKKCVLRRKGGKKKKKNWIKNNQKSIFFILFYFIVIFFHPGLSVLMAGRAISKL